MNFYPDAYVIEESAMMLFPALLSGVPGSLLSIASYVLTSMALYTLSTRRGIGKAWLSWVPVLNVWIVGSLSDQYRYVVKGQFRSKRKVLLILNLLNVLFGLLLLVVAGSIIGELINGAVYGIGEKELLSAIMGSAMGAVGLCLPMAGIAIAAMVIRYMALYDIYTSMDPGNNVLYLVLSILFNITEPFFLFFNRNKDTGMPPRRAEPQWAPQEPVSSAWEEEKDYQ